MKTSFLITAKNETSEFLLNFVDVQEYMNSLEKLGIVTNVLVRKFENMVMTKEIVYDYNGESWEKKNVIHLYNLSHIFGKSKCGIDYENIKDYSSKIKYINCKNCKNNRHETIDKRRN